MEVKPSQQRGGDVERFIDETEFRFDSLEGEPCGFDRDVTGAVKSVDESAARRLKADPPSPGVVAVEDHLLWAVFPAGREQFRKKTFLGLEVIFHRMVVVEMILRQVGKNPQIKCAIVYPPQVDGVRRDLRHDVRDAMVGHLPENPLHFEGFRCGVRCGEKPSVVSVVHRSQDADGTAGRLENRLQQIGDRGLSVRSDHGDQAEPGGRVSVEIFPESSECVTAVPDPDGCNAGWGQKILFVENETCAPGQRIVDEFMTVGPETGNGYKEIVRFALPRVVADRADIAVRISRDPEYLDSLRQL